MKKYPDLPFKDIQKCDIDLNVTYDHGTKLLIWGCPFNIMHQIKLVHTTSDFCFSCPKLFKFPVFWIAFGILVKGALSC